MTYNQAVAYIAGVLEDDGPLTREELHEQLPMFGADLGVAIDRAVEEGRLVLRDGRYELPEGGRR